MKRNLCNGVLRIAGGGLLTALIALAALSAAQAYWLNGLWVPGPYPYYRAPLAYYGPGPGSGHYPGQDVWVPQHWDGNHLMPGHWRAY